MARQKQRGFTIIEVSLFLAISGLLSAMLMTGWTAKINQERYKDSVHTMQTFLQQQYNLVYNVENGRAANLDCTNATSDSPVDATRRTPRGQGDCVLLGRYVTIDGTGGDITIRAESVIGLAEPVTLIDNSVFAFLQYAPKTVKQDIPLSDASLEVPWAPAIDSIDNNASLNKQVSLAILRSPVTGTVNTYINTGRLNDNFGYFKSLSDYDVADSILSSVGQPVGDTRICLDPQAPFSGQRMAIVIKKGVSSQSGIETVAGC